MVAGCGQGIQPTLRPVDPDQLQAALPQAQRAAKRHVGHPAVYLRIYDRVVHQPRDEAGLMRHLRVRRYVVLNPQHARYSTFRLSLAKPQRLLRLDLATVSPDGRVRRFGRKDLISERHLGGRTVLKLVYPDVRAGTVVEERTEVMVPLSLAHLGALQRHRFALQRTVPVLDMELDYYLPRYWSFTFKPSSKRVRQRIQRSFPSKNLARYHYRARNVPPIRPAPYSPPLMRDLDSLDFEIQRLNIGEKWHGFRPAWKDLAAFAALLFLHESEGFKGEARQVARSLYHQRSTDAERLRAVLRYVQKHLRLAPEGIPATSLREVLRGGYGGRIQLTAVTYHLLRAAGLSVELLLAHDGNQAPFDRGFVSIHEIDEPALWVNVNGVGRVVIPWLRYWPVGLAPPHLRGQWALRVGLRGYVGWMRIPKPSGGAATRKASYDVQVRGKDLRITLEETYRGIEAHGLRLALLKRDPAGRKRLLRRSLARHGRRLEVHGIRIRGLTDEREPLRVTSRFTLRGAVFRPGDRAVIRLDTGRVRTLGAGGGRHRKRPCQIREPRRDVEELTIRYPSGWEPLRSPAPHALRSVFGSATRELRRRRGQIWLRQILELERTWQPPAKAPELDRLLRTADRYSQVALVLRRAGSEDRLPRVAPPPAVASPPRVAPPPPVAPPRRVDPPPRRRVAPQPRPHVAPSPRHRVAPPPRHRVAPPPRRRVAPPPRRRHRVAPPPRRRRRAAPPPRRRRRVAPPPRRRRARPARPAPRRELPPMPR
jgi:hypothetical protein